MPEYLVKSPSSAFYGLSSTSVRHRLSGIRVSPVPLVLE